MILRKINLFTTNPKGCKLIFNTPFRAGAMLKINTLLICLTGRYSIQMQTAS